MPLVPKQMAAAVIWPTKYDTLKRDVMMGRSLGYDSSPINEEPETMQMGIPKPRTRRAKMYMPAGVIVSSSSPASGGFHGAYR